MVICGRVSDVLNGSRGTQRTFPDSNPSPLVLADAVKELQHTLVQHYSSVPSWMRWTSDMWVSLPMPSLSEAIKITLPFLILQV
jgi:hypothetical protein